MCLLRLLLLLSPARSCCMCTLCNHLGLLADCRGLCGFSNRASLYQFVQAQVLRGLKANIACMTGTSRAWVALLPAARTPHQLCICHHAALQQVHAVRTGAYSWRSPCSAQQQTGCGDSHPTKLAHKANVDSDFKSCNGAQKKLVMQDLNALLPALPLQAILEGGHDQLHVSSPACGKQQSTAYMSDAL